MQAADRIELLRRVESAEAAGLSFHEACIQEDVSPATARRWRKLYDQHGTAALETGKSSGRRPQCEPSTEEIIALQNLYARTNRAKGKGSKQLAARLFAQRDECSEDVKHAIMKPRASKQPPKCIRDVMDIPPAIFEIHRDPKNARLNGLHIPGGMRMKTCEDTGERRRLYAGERQSWDDASINFMVVVPWPQGGCRCSDRYGVKVGRFQLLAGVDDASGYVPGYSYVIKETEGYSSEDTVAAQFRVWRDTIMPAEVVVEGGVWQSHRAREFYETSGLKPIDAKGRPHQKLIENYWNFLWTILSVENGQIGRFRGEQRRENEILMRCKRGSEDPRKHFVMLDEALAAIDRAIHFRNHEPVQSEIYGTWVPAQRWRDDLAAHPRPTIDTSLAYLHSPVREVRTVVKDMVKVRAMSPIGEPFTYAFTCEDLWEFSGRKVRVYFDPYDAPLAATLVLDQDVGEYRAGTRITNAAVSIGDAPLVRREGSGWNVGFDDGSIRSIDMKKRISRAKMTEYRSLGLSGKPKTRESEYRDRDGNRIHISTPAGDSEHTPGRVETTPQADVPAARGSLLSSAGGAFPARRVPGAVSDDAELSHPGRRIISPSRKKEVDADELAAEADALEAQMRERGDLVDL